MNPTVEFNLTLILFLPWFAILGALFWFFPRQPRGAARRGYDLAALVLALLASWFAMRWGMVSADPNAGAIWKQVLATLVNAAAGKVPVIAHVGTPRTQDAVELAKSAEQDGASAVSLVPPYYYKYSREEIIAYYRRVLDAISIPVAQVAVYVALAAVAGVVAAVGPARRAAKVDVLKAVVTD